MHSKRHQWDENKEIGIESQWSYKCWYRIFRQFRPFQEWVNIPFAHTNPEPILRSTRTKKAQFWVTTTTRHNRSRHQPQSHWKHWDRIFGDFHQKQKDHFDSFEDTGMQDYDQRSCSCVQSDRPLVFPQGTWHFAKWDWHEHERQSEVWKAAS